MSRIIITDFAPVVIPTLNRYEHFKRCLDSLERCTWADHTDVYVGLDYPPSAKYVDGWKKIDAYLAEKEKKNGFKNLIVRRRDHNLGIGHPGGNEYLVQQEVASVTDKYIFSEDDNEFSPNFLEYMNKALDKYKDDDRVIRISAYTPPVFYNLTDENTFFGVDTPAYGIGSWQHKNADVHIVDYKEINTALRSSFWRTWNLFWTYPALIYMAVHMVRAKKNYGDIRYSMNNLLCGTFTLEPTQSLSRNWGGDGTGLHSGVVKGLEKEEIQTELHFELQDIPFEYPEKLRKRLRFRNMPKSNTKYYIFLIYKFLYVMRFFFFG